MSHTQQVRQNVRQRGFSLVFLLLALAVVGVAGYTGYKVIMPRLQTAATPADTSAVRTLSFTGQSAADGQPLTTSSNASAAAPSGNSSASTPAAGSGAASSSTSNTTTAAPSQPATSPTTPIYSGITGQVTVTLSCATHACPQYKCATACPGQNAPYQATVIVESATGAAVTSFTSDSHGNFTVTLAPGTYTLVPQAYDSGHITAPSQKVTVVVHKLTPVLIAYHQS